MTNEYVDATTVPPDEEGLCYGEDLLKQMRELVWTKGDYKIVPYGSIWGSTAHDTQRTNPGAFVLWVFSEANTTTIRSSWILGTLGWDSISRGRRSHG